VQGKLGGTYSQVFVSCEVVVEPWQVVYLVLFCNPFELHALQALYCVVQLVSAAFDFSVLGKKIEKAEKIKAEINSKERGMAHRIFV